MTEDAAPRRSAKEQFDRQAAHYNAQWNSWSDESLAWLLEHARPMTEDDVLDVATGTGFTALAFAPHVRSVVGLDVSSGMLEQASRKAQAAGLTNVEFREGAAESLPFSDSSFDIVTCRIAAHHFLSVTEFVREAARVLRSGGRFVLADTSVPDDEPEADAWQNAVEKLRDPSHIRNCTPREWRGFVEAAGLEVNEVSMTGLGVPIPLSDWLVKAGCTPEQSGGVKHAFETAPESALRLFRIALLPDGDTGFIWQRVTLSALKPSA